ncbi:MAG TPA: ABC transporter permease [Spirochaetota bacterium]|nr:ABC transporter permease [Spirochaetota bacterium]
MQPGILAVVVREIGRMRSRALYPVVMIILPVLSAVIFIAMFHDGVPRNLPVAVLDNDNSALSRKLVRMIDSLPSISVKYRVNDMLEGREEVSGGNAFALVVIPRDFEKDVYRFHAPRVCNYYNNQYLLIGSTMQKDVYAAVRSLSAGINVLTRMKKGEPLYQAKVSAQPIELQQHVMYNPYTNYMYYLVSSLLPNMLHIFVILTAIYALGIELKERTIADLVQTAGGSCFRAIVGKYIPYIVVFSMLGVGMNVLLFKVLDVPMRGNFLILLAATVALILAYIAVGIFFLTLVANVRFALMMSAFYASTAYTFIGMTFPIISFPVFGFSLRKS